MRRHLPWQPEDREDDLVGSNESPSSLEPLCSTLCPLRVFGGREVCVYGVEDPRQVADLTQLAAADTPELSKHLGDRSESTTEVSEPLLKFRHLLVLRQKSGSLI